MKKRLLTGIVYIGIITGFFFLRRIHPWFFGILIYAFSLIGTFEMVRALNYRKQTENGELLPAVMPMSLSQKVSVFVYAALFVPVYYLAKKFWQGRGMEALVLLFFAFSIAMLCLLVFDHERTSLTGAGGGLLCAFYPTGMLATMLFANDLATFSTLALLLIFVISPVADTFAFVVGSLVKGKKLCPKISPHKTISGAVGGIVFGTGASVLLYWLYTLTTGTVYTGSVNPWLMMAIIGLIASIVTEFGDLVESIIKRKTGIKDMGKLLPGHGGILDRIDGTLFTSVFVYLCFAFFIV